MSKNFENEDHPQNKFRKKFYDEGQKFPNRIRRCFMTGKQCIFCSYASSSYPQEFAENEFDEGDSSSFSVFVIMPFQPTFDTFYEWSLKRYLSEGLKIEDTEKDIRRADEFRDIGYVMCEKICRRIQEANLVVVDLSIENPNVMYEMGLAVGLNKPLLIICNQTNYKGRLNDDFLKSIGLKEENNQFDIVDYPSVGYLDANDKDPIENAKRIELESRNAQMKIVPLLIADKERDETNKETSKRDISSTFSEALRGAIGVATKQISESSAKDTKEAIEILKPKGVQELGRINENDVIIIIDSKDKPKTFKEVFKKVDNAFTCIIDLVDENPISYYWLGYCHARGINAIPISRSTKEVNSIHDNKNGLMYKNSEHPNKFKDKHVIAFDIRALWHIRYEPNKIKDLANALRSALEELISKDVPRQQRNIFWERLTRQPRIHIYTGAVHHKELNREVVGDWDQRTVSELVRYLSSAEESVIPELERPIYSPSTIKSKLEEDWDEEKSLQSYIDLVKSELADKNCIIVASADVNALTEVILSHAYGIEYACFHDPTKIEIEPAKRKKVVIALKGWESKKEEKEDSLTIPTFFSRSGSRDNLDKGKRGFKINDNEEPLQELYKSQDKVTYNEKGFSLLSHLVIMHNPFFNKNKDAIIVLLNGVSGPGTFGLAEVLTGGKTTEKTIVSEKILEQFNLKWNEGKGRFGIESIIQVKIRAQETRSSNISNVNDGTFKISSKNNKTGKLKQTVQDKFYDLREVVEWDFYRNPALISENENPREFKIDSFKI
jgi:hypothetical protein